MTNFQAVDDTATVASASPRFRHYIRRRFPQTLDNVLAPNPDGFLTSRNEYELLWADLDELTTFESREFLLHSKSLNDILAASFISVPASSEVEAGPTSWVNASFSLYGQSHGLVESDRSLETGTPPLGETVLMASFDRLNELARLARNWDSYGAEPVSQAAISKAGAFLAAVRRLLGARCGERIRPYSIAPVADGGVQLEWRSSGAKLEVEVGPEGDLGYLWMEGAEPHRTFEEADEVAQADVLSLVSRVLLT